MLKNEKGITLLELLVAISLSSLVIALAVQMYITNSSTLTLAKEKANLTSHAQYVQEELTKYGLQSQGLSNILIDGEDYLDKTNDELKSVDSLMFKLESGDITFEYKTESKTIELGGALLASNITKFIVLPIPADRSFEKANGIKVILELTTSNTRRPVTYEATTIIGFRNR